MSLKNKKSKPSKDDHSKFDGIQTLCSRISAASANILQDFGSFTSLHGVKNISEDFQYLNKLSARSRLPKR